MARQIDCAGGWSVRLYRNGKFALVRGGAVQLQADAPHGLAAALVSAVERGDVLSVRDALVAAGGWCLEAGTLRREYHSKLAVARQALAAQQAERDVSADLAELQRLAASVAVGGAAK